MSQSYVNAIRMESQESDTCVPKPLKNRKVSINIDGVHHVSVYQNGDGEVVVNIKRGTRSVTISKSIMLEICGLKEIITQCCSFTDS